MRFEDYLVYAGHGSFFQEVPGVKRGEGSVALQAGPKGEPKVVAPELIVAWLQESYTGSENAPKGGLLRRGHGSPSRLPSLSSKRLCGDPSGWKSEAAGCAYPDEPYSMQAYDKRVYGIRDVYKRCLKGTAVDNPAEDELVTGYHSSLRLLLGYKEFLLFPGGATGVGPATFIGWWVL